MSALVEAARAETTRMDEVDLSQALVKAQILVTNPQGRDAQQLPPIERRKEMLRNAAYALKQMWDDLDDTKRVSARKRPALA